jgi:hypothetical protein
MFIAAQVLTLGPYAHAQTNGGPPPPGLYPETAPKQRLPNRKLLYVGAGVLAAGYISSVIIAATSSHDGDDWLYAPVIGPFVDLAVRGCAGPTATNCGTSTGHGAGLFVLGLAQVVGAATLTMAFLVPESERGPTAPQPPPAPTLSIAPARLSQYSWGLSVFVRH